MTTNLVGDSDMKFWQLVTAWNLESLHQTSFQGHAVKFAQQFAQMIRSDTGPWIL